MEENVPAPIPPAPTTAPTPAQIVLAARRLASVCDGAVARDLSGYNAVDGPTAKSILAQTSPTPGQIRCLWKILRKYTKQLAGFGVDYGTLVPPELPPRGEAGRFMPPQNRVRIVWVDTAHGRKLAVVFAYNADILAAVKKVGRAFFDKDGSKNSKGLRNAWIFPAEIERYDVLVEEISRISPPVQFDPAPEVASAMEGDRRRRAENLVQSRAETSDFEVPTRIPLYPYQRAGVQWIDSHAGRALVADDMGLGKTPQTLGWLAMHPEALPALVVCPSSVRVAWRDRAREFTDLKTLVLTSKTSLKAFEKAGVEVALEPADGYDIVVINYDLFRWQKKELPKDITKPKSKKKVGSSFVNGIQVSKDGDPVESPFSRFKTIVWDEIHKIKDPASQRAKVAVDLVKGRPYVLGLTGTPLMNRPIEIFHPMRLITPGAFTNVIEYGKKFCNGFQSRFGWDFSGASNLEDLDHLLRAKGGMIRRLKDDVLKELPAKMRVTIPIVLEGGKAAAYEKEAKPILEKLSKQKTERDLWKEKMAALSDEDRKAYISRHAEQALAASRLSGYMMDEIDHLKQAAAFAKYDEAIKFLLDLADGRKLLVFATHHGMVDRMAADFAKEKLEIETIDGRTDQAARPGIVERFQKGTLQVIVGGIRAMAEGLTLTAASHVAFMELDWNPAQHSQAEDRCHRISQKFPVTAYYLVAAGTIEEKIARMIDAKREVTFASMGEQDRTLSEKGIMDSILDEIL